MLSHMKKPQKKDYFPIIKFGNITKTLYICIRFWGSTERLEVNLMLLFEYH